MSSKINIQSYKIPIQFTNLRHFCPFKPSFVLIAVLFKLSIDILVVFFSSSLITEA